METDAYVRRAVEAVIKEQGLTAAAFLRRIKGVIG